MSPDSETAEDHAAPEELAEDDEVLDGEIVDEEAAPAPAADDAGEDAVERDAAAAAGIPELTEMEQLVAERDEYLDALRRLKADFDNFRKRVQRQEKDLWTRAIESLVERLLPVIDATQLAMEHAGDEKDATAFSQVASLLWDVLSKEGLERIDAAGVPFEPAVHDAVARVPDDDAAADGESDGQVVEAVLRPGFLLRGKVLRPAMVTVRG
jgi:molecular chaperone GrpE